MSCIAWPWIWVTLIFRTLAAFCATSLTSPHWLLGGGPALVTNAMWHDVLTVNASKQVACDNACYDQPWTAIQVWIGCKRFVQVNSKDAKGFVFCSLEVWANLFQPWRTIMNTELISTTLAQELFLKRVLFLHERAVKRGCRGTNARLVFQEWTNECDPWSWLNNLLVVSELPTAYKTRCLCFLKSQQRSIDLYGIYLKFPNTEHPIKST